MLKAWVSRDSGAGLASLEAKNPETGGLGGFCFCGAEALGVESFIDNLCGLRVDGVQGA